MPTKSLTWAYARKYKSTADYYPRFHFVTVLVLVTSFLGLQARLATYRNRKAGTFLYLQYNYEPPPKLPRISG